MSPAPLLPSYNTSSIPSTMLEHVKSALKPTAMPPRPSFRRKPISQVAKATGPKQSTFTHPDQSTSEMTVSRIDFRKTPLPEYKDLYAILISNVLSPEECAALLERAEAHAGEAGWERAMVNIGNGRQAMYTDTRNCARIIWDSQAEIDAIFERIRDLPEVKEIHRLEDRQNVTGWGPVRRGEVWALSRPNERMRFLKYVGGEYFRPHVDGCYETPDGKERSWFTLHLYLNGSGESGQGHVAGEQSGTAVGDARDAGVEEVLLGGATAFHGDYDDERRLDVNPKAGSVLLFQHNKLVHSGADVLRGTKYTLRTDLMYTRGEAPSYMNEH